MAFSVLIKDGGTPPTREEIKKEKVLAVANE